MKDTDCLPLTEGPAAERLQGFANNRLGAVYSALYNFWCARHAAVAAGQRALGAQRRSDTAFYFLYNVKLMVWSQCQCYQGPRASFYKTGFLQRHSFRSPDYNYIGKRCEELAGPTLRHCPTSWTPRLYRFRESSPQSPRRYGEKLEQGKVCSLNLVFIVAALFLKRLEH